MRASLHHNMLFLLNYHCEIESDIGDSHESEKLLTTKQIWDDVTLNDLVDQPIYQGPRTWSHTKALMKANLVMNECFQVNETFQPAPMTICKESMNSLIIQFLFLQALIISSVI